MLPFAIRHFQFTAPPRQTQTDSSRINAQVCSKDGEREGKALSPSLTHSKRNVVVVGDVGRSGAEVAKKGNQS